MEERLVLTVYEAVVRDEEKEERIMIRGVSRFIESTVSNVDGHAYVHYTEVM